MLRSVVAACAGARTLTRLSLHSSRSCPRLISAVSAAARPGLRLCYDSVELESPADAAFVGAAFRPGVLWRSALRIGGGPIPWTLDTLQTAMDALCACADAVFEDCGGGGGDDPRDDTDEEPEEGATLPSWDRHRALPRSRRINLSIVPPAVPAAAAAAAAAAAGAESDLPNVELCAAGAAAVARFLRRCATRELHITRLCTLGRAASADGAPGGVGEPGIAPPFPPPRLVCPQLQALLDGASAPGTRLRVLSLLEMGCRMQHALAAALAAGSASGCLAPLQRSLHRLAVGAVSSEDAAAALCDAVSSPGWVCALSLRYDRYDRTLAPSRLCTDRHAAATRVLIRMLPLCGTDGSIFLDPPRQCPEAERAAVRAAARAAGAVPSLLRVLSLYINAAPRPRPSQTDRWNPLSRAVSSDAARSAIADLTTLCTSDGSDGRGSLRELMSIGGTTRLARLVSRTWRDCAPLHTLLLCVGFAHARAIDADAFDACSLRGGGGDGGGASLPSRPCPDAAAAAAHLARFLCAATVHSPPPRHAHPHPPPWLVPSPEEEAAPRLALLLLFLRLHSPRSNHVPLPSHVSAAPWCGAEGDVKLEHVAMRSALAAGATSRGGGNALPPALPPDLSLAELRALGFGIPGGVDRALTPLADFIIRIFEAAYPQSTLGAADADASAPGSGSTGGPALRRGGPTPLELFVKCSASPEVLLADAKAAAARLASCPELAAAVANSEPASRGERLVSGLMFDHNPDPPLIEERVGAEPSAGCSDVTRAAAETLRAARDVVDMFSEKSE